jgi:hypothetical protein
MKEQIKRVMARTFDIQISDITDDAKINGIPKWNT